MKKLVKLVSLLLVVGLFLWLGGVFQEGKTLKENLVRLHIVANSDTDEDQALKLQVRDAVTARLETAMASLSNVDEAKKWLEAHLQELQELVNEVIAQAGFRETAVVTLTREEFDTRHYDTFSLPAGIYDSLRITIGKGEGENWWCVAFPTLCIPTTGDGFSDAAAGAGFSSNLSGALRQKNGYQVRFFILDLFGRLEKFFH